MHAARTRQPRRAFTMTELMIAVAVLLVVIVATGKIFGTASRVTAVGAGSADVMQEAAAIERQLRQDFARLSEAGFFAIQQQAVPNNIHILAGNGGALINPSLPANTIVRADQLVFFMNGTNGVQTHRIGEGAFHKAQSMESRVYYGHAFQLEFANEFNTPQQVATDPAPDAEILPWTVGAVDTVETRFVSVSEGNVFGQNGGGQIDGTQPEARQWLLARQPVMLADDDTGADDADSKTAYLVTGLVGNEFRGGVTTARSIFRNYAGIETPQIRDGRLDAAATTMSEIRDALTITAGDDWFTIRGLIGGEVMYYPRAERFPPGPHRVDQALTNHVIAAGCSSFIVEWTYADGVGDTPARFGTFREGARILKDDQIVVEQPWFGLPNEERNVGSFKAWQELDRVFNDSLDSIDPDNVENEFILGGRQVYQAFFGFNSTEPLDPLTGSTWDTDDTGVAYTPWPTAIRITMTLHDAATNLEQGRQFQFVINLPKRNK